MALGGPATAAAAVYDGYTLSPEDEKTLKLTEKEWYQPKLKKEAVNAYFKLLLASPQLPDLLEEQRLLDVKAHETREALVASEEAEADKKDQPDEWKAVERIDQREEEVSDRANWRNIRVDVAAICKSINRGQKVDSGSDGT